LVLGRHGFKNGVLDIHVTKTKEGKPSKIKVKAH